MILTDQIGDTRDFPTDNRLQIAVNVGAVRIDSIHLMKATILAPPGFKSFSDDEIISHLKFATECGRRLERLGFDVAY